MYIRNRKRFLIQFLKWELKPLWEYELSVLPLWFLLAERSKPKKLPFHGQLRPNFLEWTYNFLEGDERNSKKKMNFSTWSYKTSLGALTTSAKLIWPNEQVNVSLSKGNIFFKNPIHHLNWVTNTLEQQVGVPKQIYFMHFRIIDRTRP